MLHHFTAAGGSLGSQRGTFMERNLYCNLHNLIKGKYAVRNGCKYIIGRLSMLRNENSQFYYVIYASASLMKPRFIWRGVSTSSASKWLQTKLKCLSSFRKFGPF